MKTEQILRLGEASDPHGLYELGLLFVKGKSVKRDAQRGMMMIKKAAALGHQDAIDLLHDIARQQAVMDEKQKLLTAFHLQEVNTAPSLTLINSVGFRLLGRSHYDAHTQSFEATRFFVIAWLIPLFPIARYRVVKSSNRYRFIGKLPLQLQDWTPLLCYGLLMLTLALFRYAGLM